MAEATRKPPPRLPRSRGANRGFAGEPGDPLEHFLAEIRDTPLLSGEEEAALAKRMREARAGLQDALVRVPRCIRRLAEICRTAPRRAVNPARGPEGADPASLEPLLEGLERGAERLEQPSPERDRVAEEIRGLVARIDPETAVLLSVLCDLEGAQDADDPPDALALAQAREHRDAYLETRNAFLRHNLRLVIHIAKDFRHLDLPLADLIQEGNLGLVRAVEKFDERRQVRFSTYAGWWIVQACLRGAQRQGRVVRLPTHVHQRLFQLARAENQLRRSLSREPTEAELAEAAELSAEQVGELREARHRLVPFDDPTGDEEEGRPLSERLQDLRSEDPGELLDQGSLSPRLKRLFRRLDPRERRVLAARFGLGGSEPQPLRAVGQSLGISGERVRQIEKRSLEKLIDAAREARLDEFL